MREPFYSLVFIVLPLAIAAGFLFTLWAAARAARRSSERLDDLDERFLMNVEGEELERRRRLVNSWRRRQGKPPR